MKISLMLEGQEGLNWENWKYIVSHVEAWNFDGLYRSDHFIPPQPYPLGMDALETILSLGYAADHTTRIHFGPLVAPFSFRDPAMLARQAAHLDALSNGRMILGVGAGWMDREHEMFGYNLLDKKARMERFDEGLQVVWLLLKSDTPVSFQGKFFTLREAHILPRPYKTKILIGGTGINKTLRLAARYADVWNSVGVGPARFRELSAILSDYLRAEGRPLDSVSRTAATFLHYGQDRASLERELNFFKQGSETPDEIAKRLSENDRSIIGTTEQVLARLHAFADAGVEELMVQWIHFGELDSIAAFSENVLKKFK
jgi:alkanesulfonate monooxygenase SsuD/methylene tetrahydromethanopterin reductase-like flavin-dependent oxidoreductase (luciferase family)